MKYIFVTGGVASGIGKGIVAASLGRLLKSRGVAVSIQKLDPYLNVDPGTMSPHQHGEVFVTEDGAETDLDIGHYERFIGENLTKYSNITTGKIYLSVIEKERSGKYLGKTVQVVPHITDEIKENIFKAASEVNTQVVITEIGGTVGDIESQPFIEAIRQIYLDLGRENVMYIHVTLIPLIPSSGEQKSKPAQHSVKELLSFGVRPDIIVCRSAASLEEDFKQKLALFCNVKPESIIENLNVANLYDVPFNFEKQCLAEKVCQRLNIECKEPDLEDWITYSKKTRALSNKCTIALVGKYVSFHDSYLSVREALEHAGVNQCISIDIKWIDSCCVSEENVQDLFDGIHGILVPGGFGDRGVFGKVTAVKYAREKNIPFFGICLGFQVMLIEFARNVMGLKDANSTEFDFKTEYPIIDIMQSQKNSQKLGATMRLGGFSCQISKDSKAFDAYKELEIFERHRHRYEFNNAFFKEFNLHGVNFSGTSTKGNVVEIAELNEKLWFVGVQFHPEFKTRPNKPHPLFLDFVKHANIFSEKL